MKTEELLSQALLKLQSMSAEEVQKRTAEKGIVIPPSPPIYEWLDHFSVDLSGAFNDVVNSTSNYWIEEKKFLHRQSVVIQKTTIKPLNEAALLF